MELGMKLIIRCVFLYGMIPVFLATTQSLLAQSNKAFAFGSINEIGLLTGEKGEAVVFQTINGVTKDRSFVGIGLGLDYYQIRSIPLHLDYRWNFSSNRNTPFLFTSGGLNFAWFNANQKTQMD